GIEDSGHLDFRAAAWPQPETTLIEKILSNLPDNLRSKKDACPSVMRSSGIDMLEGKSAARSKPAFSARKPIPAPPSERSSQNRSSIPATAASSRKTATNLPWMTEQGRLTRSPNHRSPQSESSSPLAAS